MAFGYITSINYDLVFANASRLRVVLWEGHSHSRVHLIGHKCVVQDESSIFLVHFFLKRKTVHFKCVYLLTRVH